MRLTLCALAVAAATLHLDAAATPDQVLAASIALYPTLASYADTGSVTDAFGPQPSNVYTHTFKTYFRAPRNFYFDFTADPRSGGARYVVWCDGGDFQSWSSTTGQHETYPRGSNTATQAFLQITWATKGSAVLIPSLIFAGTGLVSTISEMSEATVSGTETITGRHADKFLGVARSVYPKTNRVTNVRRAAVWIDPETKLVRQVFEDTPQGLPPSAVARITVTLTPQLNPPLDDAVFRFAVPGRR